MSVSMAPDVVESVLTRVSILAGHTQIDVGLPAHTPIAALLPTLIATLAARERGADVPAESADPDTPVGALPQPQRWTLAPIGRSALPTQLSLYDAGVRDGDLLLLRPIRGESPVLFDDVVDALAELGADRFPNWTPVAARQVGYGVALVAAALCALTLMVTRFSASPPPWWPPIVAGSATVALLVAALMVNRHREDISTASVLTWCALLMAAACGSTASPGPPSAATVALGSAAVVIAAAVSYRLLGGSPTIHSAVTTVALIVGPAALVQLVVGTPAQVAAVVAAVGVGVAFAAPRLTAVLAKLPLPTVPTAGDPLDAADAGPASIEGIGAVGTVTLPQIEALSARTALAHAYLTGITAGAALTAAASAVVACQPAHGVEARTCAYAMIIAAVLALRGRSHSDLVQAGVLILAGATAVVAIMGGYLLAGTAATPTAALALFGCGSALFASALLGGIVAPAHDFSPVVRRVAELIEYALVASIVPVLLWILDLYSVVRSFR